MDKEYIKDYYDNHSINKFNDYINGNARVEKAWKRILQWLPVNPKSILEIGCGVGYISARLSELKPDAHVTGIDLSTESIKIAKSEFSKKNLSYYSGSIFDLELNEKYDLIIMMDVYEHIKKSERQDLHNFLNNHLSNTGRLILTFPTPECLAYLREHNPDKIQPIDEDVTLADMRIIEKQINGKLCYYNKTTIWAYNDYAHACFIKDINIYDSNTDYSDFTILELNKNNIDRFVVRSGILSAIEESQPKFIGKLLDIGCGRKPYKPLLLANGIVTEYIGMDLDTGDYFSSNRPDVCWDGRKIPFSNNSFDTIILTEVLEHIFNPVHLLKEVSRVLKPNGIIFLTVPFIWPLHDIPEDYYRYTPYSLKQILSDHGFKNISTSYLGNWNTTLASVIGLWLKRNPDANSLKEKYSDTFHLIYNELLENTNRFISDSPDTSMCNGLCLLAENNIFKTDDISVSEDKNEGEEITLAIFSPHIGAVSETFIKRQVQNLNPCKTVLVSSFIEDDLWVECPVLIVPFNSGINRYKQETEEKIINFLKQHNVTHILAQYGYTSTEIVELNSRLLHLPIFVHFHGYDASKVLNNPDIISYYQWMSRNVNGVITVSNSMRNRLLGIGMQENNLKLIHYGIEIPDELYNNDSKNNSVCRFVSTMRLVPKKGPLYLLRAFQEAKNINPYITLDIIGDGELKNEVQDFINKFNLNDSVILHGAKPFEYVKSLLHSSDVFVLHSITDPITGDTEGLPLSILEAAAYGLPVISTFHEGIPEEVEDGATGFLCREKDYVKMSEYMLLLASDAELRKSMGLKGREKVQREFTADRMIDELRDFIGIHNKAIKTAYAGESVSSDSSCMVSVIIPTYNRQDFLKQSINSVLLQTFQDFEIIIINDGGPDVQHIIDEFNSSKIKYLKHETNKGISSTRNTGLNIARGKYIAYLDDDDIFYPDHLATLIDFLENSDYSVAYTDANCNHLRKVNNEYQTINKDMPYSEDYNREKLLVNNYIPNLCVIHERACLKLTGLYDENLRTHVDWDFLVRLCIYYDFKHIKRVTCEFTLRDDNTNITSKRNEMLLSLDIIYKKTHSIVADNSKILQMREIFYNNLKNEVESLQSPVDRNTIHASIIIPVLNKLELTRNCIESIYENKTPSINFEIIIIDNASTDGTEDYLDNQKILFDNFKVIRNSENLGFAKACNQGIRAADGNYIVLLNNDTIVTRGWLENMISEAEKDKNIGIVGSLLLYPDKRTIQHAGVRITYLDGNITPFHFNRLRDIKYVPEALNSIDLQVVTGACMLMTRETIEKVGLLNDEYKNGFEDVDYCFRAGQAGFKIRYCGSSLVYHYESMTPTRHDNDDSNYLLLHKNWNNTIKADLMQEEAIQALKDLWAREILQKEPENLTYLKLLGMISTKRGNIEEANDFNHRLQLLDESSKNKELVSIIIVTHNNKKFTFTCIDNLIKKHNTLKKEIIIVDNASTDGTVDYLSGLEEDEFIKVVYNLKNESYAHANNQGAALAQGKYLIFLNNDTLPFEGWLDAFLREFNENPDTAVQGAKLLYINKTIQHAGMVFGARPGRDEEPYHPYLTVNANLPFVSKRRKVQFVTGACLAIRKEIFNEIGGFDEEYIYGWEDTDLCMKVNGLQKDIIYNPVAVLYHFESVTKKLRKSLGDDMLNPDSAREIKNRKRFFDKWGSVVKRDADTFYAEDGFRIEGDSIVAIDKTHLSKPENIISNKGQDLTSFSRAFWERNYNSASTILIKITPAIGDALMITSLISNIRLQFPNLKIYLSAIDYLQPIFHNNKNIENIFIPGSKEEQIIENKADIIVDYNKIIAKLPEYYNKIHFMNILGNIAGIKLYNKNIEYEVTKEEADWAKNEISDSGMNIGLHFYSNKDIARSYPHFEKLISLLSIKYPAAKFISFGKESLNINNGQLYDCSLMNIPLRKQIALGSQCSAFITIDSAFFHIGHNLFGKPTLLICGLTNPMLIGNQDASFAYVRNESLQCLNCYWQKKCKIECMNELQPETIEQKFDEMLKNGIKSLPEPEELEITYDGATDYEALLTNIFRNLDEPNKLIINDINNSLPAYALNWNGINIISNSEKNITPGSAIEHPEEKNNSFSGTDMNFFNFTFDEQEQPLSQEQADSYEDNREMQELNIIWEGSQFVYHSLALINREQCSNIIDTGLAELTIIPYENDRFQPGDNEKYLKLLSHDIRYKNNISDSNKKLPHVWIRHQWPPHAEPPKGSKWIIMQPWEFTTHRRDFVEIFRQADEIWTPSNFSRNSFIRSGIDFNKVQIVPNGINPELFKPSGKKFALPTDKKIKFLFVGGTIYRKGVDILLEAFSKAFTAKDDVCLVIKDMGGDSFYRGQTAKDNIDKLSRKFDAPEIHYIDDYLTEEEMAELYRACDVFVCPYRGEGFSLPTLEAMACGLPVIVTQGGSTDDFVDESYGWLIPAEKRSIGRMIDNKLLTDEAHLLEPSEEILTNILKYMYNNPSEILSRGILASYIARTRWTWNKATIKMFSRLDALYNKSMAKKAEKILCDMEDVHIILGRAEYEYNNKRYREAIEFYKEAIQTKVLSEKLTLHALNRIGEIYLAINEPEQAENHIERLLTIDIYHPDIKYLQAVLLERQNKYTESLEILTELFDKWSEMKYTSSLGYTLDDLLCFTAGIFLNEEDFDNAITLYTEALKTNSNNAEACLGAARCLLSANADDEARTMLEWAVRLNPNLEDARKLLEEIG